MTNEELQKKLDKLDEYDNAYYNGEGLISDEAYDLYKDKVYRMLPPDHPRLSKVGHAISGGWPKEAHTIMMGSQNKASDEEAIREWVGKVSRELAGEELLFVLQHKIDGFSLAVEYDGGMLRRAVTRGDGQVGDNITPNARLFRELPYRLPVKESVVCRGEGVICGKDFENIQKQVQKPYKNPRNAASGISRRYDGKFSSYVKFIAYDVNAKVKTETGKIEVLKALGFKTVKTYVCTGLQEILEVYREYKERTRHTLPYEIDGLVLKLDSIEHQMRLGEKNNRPEGQIALKFESEQGLTEIRDIIVQMGRTGKLTPCAILEPVELMGSTIKKATLHNFGYIRDNGMGTGAEVAIEKKGDIIPQVVEVIEPGIKYDLPESCPSCGGPLEFDGVNMWCRAKECRERDVSRITYWIETIDMKGFREKFVRKLWDMDKLRSASDLYKLTVDDFVAVDGMGERTVKAFFKACGETSEMFLDKFITALGIPGCSKGTAAVLAEKFGTWLRITQVTPEELRELPGFAETSSETVCSGIREVKAMAEDLLTVIKIKERKKGALTGMSFCVTGALSSMGRKEFGALVVENGGVAKDSVVAGLTYLVTNTPESGTGKNKKARKLGIEIINEEQFFGILGEKPGKKQGEPEEKKPSQEGPALVSESLF